MFGKETAFVFRSQSHFTVFLLKKLSQRTFPSVLCLAEAPVVDESRVRRCARDDETRTEKRRGAREGLVVDAARALVHAVRHRLEEERRRRETAAGRRHVAVRQAAERRATLI